MLWVGLNQSVWTDEVASLSLGTWDWSRFWAIIAIDYHPPGYFLLLRAWLWLWSPLTEVFSQISQAKLLSFLPNLCLSLGGGYLLYRRRHYMSAVIFSSAALLAPFILPYAFEIRMYSWVMLLVCVTFAAAKALVDKGSDGKMWVLLVISSVAVVYGQYFAGISVGLIWLWLAWQLVSAKNWQMLWQFIVCVGAALILAWPSVELAYKQSRSLSHHPLATATLPVPADYWWHFPASMVVPLGAAPTVTASAFSLSVTNMLLVGIVVVSLIGLTPKCYRRENLTIGFVWLGTYFIGVILYHYGVPFIPRYLFPVSGLLWWAWSLIFAQEWGELSSLRRGWLVALALGTLVLLAVNTYRFVRLELAFTRDTAVYTDWRKETLTENPASVAYYDVGSLCLLETMRFAQTFESAQCVPFGEQDVTPLLTEAVEASRDAYLISYRAPCKKMPAAFPSWQLKEVYHASPDNPQCQSTGILCPYNLVTPQCVYRVTRKE